MKLFAKILRSLLEKVDNDKEKRDQTPIQEEKIVDVEINNTDNSNNSNTIELSMAKKTVITKVMDVETSDSIVEFPQNRTLLMEQLTDEAPVKPEIVKGLRTMDDVFDHYKPNVKVEFEDPDGQSKKETLSFNSLRDFEKDGLIKNSEFLKELGQKKENYERIEKQMRANKVLRDAVSDSESKAAMIKSLQALLKELQDAK